MQDFSTVVLVFGGLLFGLFVTIAALEERFPSIKEWKFLKWLSEALIVVVMICVPVFVVSLLVESSNAPSGFEKCMQGVENSTDPEAIAWMEDYCYERNSG